MLTVISIHAKVAARFTELSAPLMVGGDLVSPGVSGSLSTCQWFC